MDLFRNMGAVVSIKDSGSQAEQVKRLILKLVVLVCLGGNLGWYLEQDYWEQGSHFRLWHCVFGKKKQTYIFQCLGLPLFQQYCSTSCKYVVCKLMNTKPGCFLREKSCICANGIKKAIHTILFGGLSVLLNTLSLNNRPTACSDEIFSCQPGIYRILKY